MDYEYMTVRNFSQSNFEDELNLLARKRWRVVGFSAEGGRYVALLERKV